MLLNGKLQRANRSLSFNSFNSFPSNVASSVGDLDPYASALTFCIVPPLEETIPHLYLYSSSFYIQWKKEDGSTIYPTSIIQG